MKNFLIVLISLFFVVHTNAQISGYLGKRVSIFYSGGLSFPHLSSYNGDRLSARPSLNHGLNVEYLVKTHIAIGLQYKLATSATLNPKAYNIYEGFELSSKFLSHSYSFYGKFYFHKLRAPLSAYVKMGIGFMSLNIKDLVYRADSGIKKGSASTFDFKYSISYGKNWIVADYLILGMEIESSLAFLSLFRGFYDDSSDLQILRANARKVNFPTELLKLSLNVGFIAF